MKRSCLIICSSVMLLNLFCAFQPTRAADNIVVHTESVTRQLPSDGPNSMFVQRGTTWFFSERTGLNLVHGRILIDAKQPTSIKTSNARIELKKHARAAIETDRGITRIQSFSQADHILVSGFEVGTGQELLLTEREPMQDQINPLDGVGRRVTSQATLADGQFCTISDFSIAAFLKYVPTAKEMRAQDDAMTYELMKSCCAVEYVLRNRPRYQTRQTSSTCVAAAN